MHPQPTSDSSNTFEDLWRTRLQDPSSQTYAKGNNLRVDAAARVLSGGKNLLDVGCGAGVLGVAVRGRFERVHGVDIAESAVAAAARQGVLARCVDLSRNPLPFPSGSFDAVALLAVLPYVLDPRELVRECYRVLGPGGQVVVSAANMRSLGKLVRLFLRGRFPITSKLSSSFCDGGAMHYFCSADLAALLREVGFQNISRAGIFCRPRLVEHVPDWLPVLGHLKAEFFAGESFLVARKPGLAVRSDA